MALHRKLFIIFFFGLQHLKSLKLSFLKKAFGVGEEQLVLWRDEKLGQCVSSHTQPTTNQTGARTADDFSRKISNRKSLQNDITDERCFVTKGSEENEIYCTTINH